MSRTHNIQAMRAGGEAQPSRKNSRAPGIRAAWRSASRMT
jgi:hypothetical protein